jgi:exopolysaccharide biosynthesis polyprenyl glycosylphosphotransferase
MMATSGLKIIGQCVADDISTKGLEVFRYSTERLSGLMDLSSPLADQTAVSVAAACDLAVAGARRLIDIFISLTMLGLTAPLLFIVALLVKVDSGGPILYRQERLGLNGRKFIIFKIRSMYIDAEAAGPQWAARQDPRVTRVGRWLRLSRIDELPQFFNVLEGTMSVIGPRPERSHFVEQLAPLIPRYTERLSVRPGITGWAQVNYPYSASLDDAQKKLSFDLYYVTHRTFALDLRILLQTVRVVLTLNGAR